jgi:hypothetical protein
MEIVRPRASVEMDCWAAVDWAALRTASNALIVLWQNSGNAVNHHPSEQYRHKITTSENVA